VDDVDDWDGFRRAVEAQREAQSALWRMTLPRLIDLTRAKVLAGGGEQTLQLYESLIVEQALQLAVADNTDRMLVALQDYDGS
jgi:hypothetical protein